MHRTLVLNVVGLAPKLVGAHTPALARIAREGTQKPLRTIVPAVTCSVQSTLLTGALPREHGIVGNGWYFRDLAEVWLWRQSNHLVGGEKVWQAAKRHDPAFTCANLFWWYAMYAATDVTVTPRPMYPADGRKLPDVWTAPGALRDELQAKLGQFPLFNFWGPTAGITSSEWIGRAARHVWDAQRSTLMLVYLPHLDYALQKLGPAHPDIARELSAIDSVVGELVAHVARDGARIVVCSEYGMTPVSDAVHVNRALRRAGLVRVREELGREVLDPGASDAFAVADHQVAHVYVRERERVADVKALVAGLDGVERVLDEEGKRALGLDHPRAGELVAISCADRWFSYYYWLDDERAPDFARTVDIHRKPGYDPVELFVDPALAFPAAKIGMRLAQKALGMRMLMDVIPLDTTLVRGSHGRPTDDAADGPLVMSTEPGLLGEREAVEATGFKELVLDHVFGR